MDARARLLCYPRGSFYPLSPALPMKKRGITKTDFRPSSSRRSHYQAGLNLYAFPTISIRGKPTFVPLRYLFAGYRPSKTAHLALSPPAYAAGLSKDLTHSNERCYMIARRLPPTLDYRNRQINAKLQ